MSLPLRLLLAVNIACMGGATMFVFLNAYLLANGLAKDQVGICEGAFWIVSVLLQPWLGPALDRRGRVLFLRLGAALLALAALGYAYLSPSLAIILALRVLQGAGFALYLTSAWAFVADHAPPEKMHAIFGIFGISSLGGSIIGPVAAQLLRGAHPHQDQRVFAAAGALMGAASLVLWLLKDAPRSPVEHSQGGSLLQLAKRPRLHGLLVGSLSFGLAVGSIFAFAAAYLEKIGVESVSGLFVVLTLVAGAGRAFCGQLSNRFGAGRLIMPCLICLAVGSGGLGSLQFLAHPSTAVILAVGGVAGIGYGLVYPLLNALAYERLEAHERGRGVSLVAASIDSGNAVGAAIAGLLAQNLGEGNMFLSMGAAITVTALLSGLLDRKR